MTPTGGDMNRLGRWLPILAAILAFVAFLPALRAGFVNWDDEAGFLTNTAYRGLGWTEIRWAFTTTLLGHWSPLAWITWSVNYVTGGLEPWGYHLGNLLLHAGNVVLVWLLARRLLASGSDESLTNRSVAAGATLAALLWGLHPLRAEPVAWVSARRDLLCGFFYLLAALAYLRGVAGGAAIQPRWWGLSLAAFAAALSSKSIAMTLPLSLLLVDAYPLRRRGLGWRWRSYPTGCSRRRPPSWPSWRGRRPATSRRTRSTARARGWRSAPMPGGSLSGSASGPRISLRCTSCPGVSTWVRRGR
jgi:hypothetical protein